MLGDCHIHMILDGVYYRAAIDHHKEKPDEGLIRQRLSDYAARGITYLRDGGDAWGVGLLASKLAAEYGITYRTPAFNICRAGHYGCFIGKGFSDFSEYKALVGEVRSLGGHFIKIMVSGLMDFDRFGVITDTPCSYELCHDMIAYAHDRGLAVMAHANGDEAVSDALRAGVDSIEHGAYLSDETLHLLAETEAVWVPTAVTIANLIGEGRFPDAVLAPLLELHLGNVSKAASFGAKLALGTDAGAYAVYHGEAVAQEACLLRNAIGNGADEILRQGERSIQEKF
ncbi:MAG: amidohydrolase family protein [Oscillospiraceae bacterium]|nr:amidohydrolase family protein [Oscillospiraceae bacterium]